MAPINIRGNTLDPGNPQADIHLPPDASKTNYVLVQLKEGMTPSIVTALTDKGATIIKRMVDNTWLVNYPPNDLRALESIDGVDYALVYIDHFVVHPKLKQSSSETGQDKCVVAVVLHEAASSSNQEVLHQIQSFCAPEVLVNTHGMLHLKVNQQDLEKIAALDSVQAIEKVHPIVSHNDRTRDIIGVNAVNAVLKASNKSELTGAGQVVAIADNGIDITHEALKDKVIARHSYRKEGVEDLSGHGTHVAGTVAGRTVKNWKGDDVMGMAPNAKLISLAMISSEKPNALPTTWYNDAIQDAPTACRISNNSWGNSFTGLDSKQEPYGPDNAEIIDGWALLNPDFLVVRSAGNDGWAAGLPPPFSVQAQISSWATGKNVLTVGSTYNDRPTKDNRVDYSLAKFENKLNTVATSSSRGPVLNTKRTKPDVVAPGNGILSVRCSLTTQSLQDNLDTWSFAFGSYPGDPKPTDKLIICSGTSQACPAVSGCAALIREAFEKWHNLKTPSAALMKALLINGADDLGVSSNLQGFGKVNLSRALRPLGPPTSSTATTTPVPGSGFAFGTVLIHHLNQVIPYTTVVPAKTSSNKKLNFVATLVYHDFKGPEINNQMNLVVTYKNVKKETFNYTNTAANNENVLRIMLPDVVTGENISIGVQLKLLSAGTSVPWGLAWDHFET